MSYSKKLTIGILAHVDAGKTTLSEAMLFKAGAIREPGRVDHKSTFLDTDVQEKERGITIFAGQAEFVLPTDSTSGKNETRVMLLDTPGHVDFSAEMERTLGVLDYAVLVISGKDGVQGHTATLWKLLARYDIPTFVFVNKMDLDGTDRQVLLDELKTGLDSACCDMKDTEEIAACDEVMLEEYLETGSVSDDSVCRAVAERRLFPVYFGSALKLEGVGMLMDGLSRLTLGYGEENDAENRPDSDSEPEIRVFRITRDKQGERLTHMKILSGTLKARDSLCYTAGEETLQEKVNQIRIYSGEKYRTVESAGPGTICAVTGLSGSCPNGSEPQLEAVMTYGVILPEGTNVHDAYSKFSQLAEEDPQLHIAWNEQLQEIQIRLMGQVQLEVLEELVRSRFGINVRFGQGRIAYRETIAEPVQGAGHFEPLRHYAEVHLLMEPLPAGSGLEFGSAVSSDVLDTNWQRLIMTHLTEKEHAGTLTGSPITDMRITIIGGRAHDKHTEGGDFRQSTYRAIRQALRKSLEEGNMILLEPWYEFELTVPCEMVGRAMADVQRMGGSFETPEDTVGGSVLRGRAPVSEMKDYAGEVASYTKGYGQLALSPAGYEACHNQEQVVMDTGYDADRDTDNPADSVFCSHGAGHNVPWNEADDMMHVSCDVCAGGTEDDDAGGTAFATPAGGSLSSSDEDDLNRIFERTYRSGNTGTKKKKREIEPRVFEAEKKRKTKPEENLPEYLLVDGYNIIFAWEELKELARVNIDAAREALIDILNNYRGYRKCDVIAVFDAYRVKGGERHFEKQGDVTVVFTAEAETADTFIERTTYELSGKGRLDEEGGRRRYRVRVATSDRQEQMIITGNDALRVSASDFKSEVEAVEAEIGRVIAEISRKNKIENQNRIVIPTRENRSEK